MSVALIEKLKLKPSPVKKTLYSVNVPVKQQLVDVNISVVNKTRENLIDREKGCALEFVENQLLECLPKNFDRIV